MVSAQNKASRTIDFDFSHTIRFSGLWNTTKDIWPFFVQQSKAIILNGKQRWSRSLAFWICEVSKACGQKLAIVQGCLKGVENMLLYMRKQPPLKFQSMSRNNSSSNINFFFLTLLRTEKKCSGNFKFLSYFFHTLMFRAKYSNKLILIIKHRQPSLQDGQTDSSFFFHLICVWYQLHTSRSPVQL